MNSNTVPSIGNLSEGIKANNSAIRVIEFVYGVLQEWGDNPSRANEEVEEKLNSQLCKYLNLKARDIDYLMIIFHHEERQTDNRRVDISVVSADSSLLDKPILVIECKRLPTPGTSREQEYVTGGDKKSGGIQRFKLGLHGGELKLVAMIGYIQKESLGHWHGKINEWILELSNGKSLDSLDWSKDKVLHLVDESIDTAKYRSEHLRIKENTIDRIMIYHLWIVMNNQLNN